ncbi:MAG TPA: ATP-binding protein [Candidatus Limnocylindrales bacterium]|nr:ATP-binding protein [Candidatus Limnocylindrales bacterium]
MRTSAQGIVAPRRPEAGPLPALFTPTWLLAAAAVLPLAAARDPFFSGRPEELRVPPSRRLGLSTSSGLVESHGGTISLASALGRGTVVDVRLPASSEGSQVHREQNR